MRAVRRGARASRRRPEAARPHDLLFIQRAERSDPIAVEVDRPLAFHPRLVGFWRGAEFHQITRVVATRREHDAIYYRVLTDRGAFDLRCIRRMDPLTLRPRRVWEVCAELDAIPVARLG
ncbi:MAG: hypothetical protein HY355_05450 [Armatimonadetes bacterium]|nr:hypothetical protein [Armatimonadota bacterium]